MNNEINYKNNPLNGVSLKNMLAELVSHYGFDILFAYLNINCFKTNPSIESSAKFLKKTQWAREKVELFYLYRFKNLPRVSSEQFDIPPRDRIIPGDLLPRPAAELSLEDAERVRQQSAKKTAERNQSNRNRSRGVKSRKTNNDQDKSAKSSTSPISGDVDPWAKWRK